MNDIPFWPQREEFRHLLRRVPNGQGWSGISVGLGWAGIVVEADRKLAELDPDYQIEQVKEKFGGLRFYCSIDHLDEAVAIIRLAERLAALTCENCGSRDQVTTAPTGRTNWIYTLCAACRSVRA